MAECIIEKVFSDAFQLSPPVPSWQWAAENVDYKRAANYDTPYRGPFDPELMPFWKEPLEVARCRDTREIVVMKSSRAGYSENFLLTDLRYTVAREPEPTLYISGSMDLTVGFLDRRVIRGMKLAKETEDYYRKARAVKQDVQFPHMDFRATWASSDTATKQDGWARIHCDEVSLWKEFTVDMVRRRAAAYPFHHIVFGGSIDPTRRGNPEEDPVLKLYEESDQRVWQMCWNGEVFTWSLDGVKWSQDAFDGDEWDLNAVERGAYYETPNGQRIDEAQRMEVVRTGQWVPTNPNGIRAGFKVVGPMIPFADCGFGTLAKKFLSAKHRMNLSESKTDRVNNTLRTYFAEYWAEAHRDEAEAVQDDSLSAVKSDYSIGNVLLPNKLTHGIFCTVDVQKYHLWWVARAWAYDADGEIAHSCLVDYGNSPGFEELDETLADFKPNMVGIDIGYALRQSEVADYCAQYTPGAPKDSQVIALRGSDKVEKNTINWIERDSREGRGGGFSPYLELTWAVDVFRTQLVDSLNGGENWHIPSTWNDERKFRQYARQVTSTSKVDGEWIVKGRDDHLFDCEAMQLVLARWDGMI